MSLTSDLKKRFAETEAKVIEIDGLPPVYYKALTLGQIREIEAQEDTFSRIAKHFQVRAKDAEGRPLVNAAEFDDFMRYADAELITDAVAKMQSTDETFEDTEKKS